MLMADLGDIRLHYQIDGPEDGAPVVFANSLGTDLRLWDPVVPHLPNVPKSTGPLVHERTVVVPLSLTRIAPTMVGVPPVVAGLTVAVVGVPAVCAPIQLVLLPRR